MAVTLGELDRRLTKITMEAAVREVRLNNIRDDVSDLKKEMQAVRRALYTAGLSLLVAAVLFAVTVFASGFGHA